MNKLMEMYSSLREKFIPIEKEFNYCAPKKSIVLFACIQFIHSVVEHTVTSPLNRIKILQQVGHLNHSTPKFSNNLAIAIKGSIITRITPAIWDKRPFQRQSHMHI